MLEADKGRFPVRQCEYVTATSPAPNPFSLAGPAVFEQALREAGFRAVSIQAIPLQFQFASKEAVLQLPNPMVTNAMEQLNQPDQQRVQAEIVQAMGQFEGSQGLVVPAEVLLGVGTR